MTSQIHRSLLCFSASGAGRLAGAAALFAASLVGCASSSSKSSSAHAAAQPAAGGRVASRLDAAPADHDAYAALGYRMSWRGFAVMSRAGKVSSVSLEGDAVLVQDTGNVLTLLESSTGASRWSSTLGADLTRFVGVTRRDADILAASDTDIYTLDIATGVQTRRDRLAVVVNTRPLVMGDTVVFGCATGEVLGHSLYTGYRKWGYKLNGAIVANPAPVGELVGVVSQGGEVIVLDPATGASTMRASIFGGLACDPVGDHEALYVASLDQSIYAFEAYGKKARWRYRTDRPLTEQPTVATTPEAELLFVAIPGTGLTCFDAATGEKRWTATDVIGTVVGMRDGKLLVWRAETSQAGLIDPKSGDVLGSVALPGVKHLRTSAFENGDLYLVTAAGVVTKLVPKV